ncbi:MAG: hypothetical protein K6E75_07365 [Lachnospiraceae bacterium]|nr:hypothetical protein [Lachnospiraceae bacterium]
MKKTKLILSAAVTAAMVCLTAFPVFAAGSATVDLTQKDKNGQYIYQNLETGSEGIYKALQAAKDSGQIKSELCQEAVAGIQEAAQALGGTPTSNNQIEGLVDLTDIDADGTIDMFVWAGPVKAGEEVIFYMVDIMPSSTSNLAGKEYTLTLNDASKAKADANAFDSVTFKFPADAKPMEFEKKSDDGQGGGNGNTDSKTDSKTDDQAKTDSQQQTQASVTPKLTVKASKKSLKKGFKKKQTLNLKVTTDSTGKVSYSVASNSKKLKKYISVNAKGKVTLKKKAIKGTYKVVVKVAADGKYKEASKTIKIKVK